MTNGLFGYIKNFGIFLSDVGIPLLLGFAFIVFCVNVIRYFVFQGNTEDGQKKAKAQALYSVAAFGIIFILWGIVLLVSSMFNLGGYRQPCPDYLANKEGNPCDWGNQSRPPSNVGE